MKMKEKTKQELTKLADIMVANYRIKDIKGTSEFLEYAIHEASENELDVNWQTIRLHEKWLELKCQSLIAPEKPKQEIVEEQKCNDSKKLLFSIEYYSDGTYLKVEPKKREELIEVVEEPNYSMFVLGEDGWIVLKGSYKGKTLDEIDVVNFKGAKKGWAKWCLQNDKDLTDDDRDIFNKILNNEL